jgi:TIR domain-containing protein
VPIIWCVHGYQFDVFLSYSRRGSAPKWVENHFYPKFQDCLADQIVPTPTTFLDTSMQRGTDWPAELAKALRHSKILIPVLTPLYFQSRWCMAEWRSMLAREKLLGLGGNDRPQGLIFPVLYSDSENFPEEGLRRAWWDFKQLATPEPVFQQSRRWVDFHDRVTDVATEVGKLLRQVPEWSPDWPVERPDPVIMLPPPIPRFG